MDKANLTSSGSTRTLSPSPPHNRISRPISYIRPTGKQIISSDSLEITKNLGEGEFGIVQQGLWQTEEGEKVNLPPTTPSLVSSTGCRPASLCHGPLSVVRPSVHALTFSLNIFFAETTFRILMKFHRNVPTMVLIRIS